MRALIITAVIAVAAGCAGGDGGGDYTITDDALTFETGSFQVPPGDVFECFYTDVITDRELAVAAASADQSQGGHHVTLYYTSIIKDAQHHPCDPAEMADWRMIGGGGDEAEDLVTKLRMPDGYAIRVPAGVQLVLQSHYINLGEEFTANDQAAIELVPADSIESFVNQFVVNDAGFAVPPHEEFESVSTCTVPEDVQLIRLLGHMHEWGSYYKLEEIDQADETLSTILDLEWDPVYASDPEVLQWEPAEPMLLAQGTRLRQTCRWFNDTADPILFPREMCVAFGLYYPDDGEIFCE